MGISPAPYAAKRSSSSISIERQTTYGCEMTHLEGIPSDQLPKVLSTGLTDVQLAFISLSTREPHGRDAEYIEWHSLDHRPEQYRLAGLRNSLRLVSTPACRAVRAASTEVYDAVDHVMTYLFTDVESLVPFADLGGALHEGGRMPLRLPTVEFMTADLAGKVAAPIAVAGSDVIPGARLRVFISSSRGDRLQRTTSRLFLELLAFGGITGRLRPSRLRPMPENFRLPIATWTMIRW